MPERPSPCMLDLALKARYKHTNTWVPVRRWEGVVLVVHYMEGKEREKNNNF